MKPYIITGGTGFIQPSGEHLGVGQRIELDDDVADAHRSILRELDADEQLAYDAEQAVKKQTPVVAAAKPKAKGAEVNLFGAAGAGGQAG